MMSILARTKQYMSMLELMEEMGKMGSVLTIETFEIAIKAFAGAREMKKAVQMFDLMERYDDSMPCRSQCLGLTFCWMLWAELN
jgi:pentatricopeptide repeat protein